MENLQLQHVACAQLTAPDDAPFVAFALDSSAGLAFALTAAGTVLCLGEHGGHRGQLLWSVQLPPEEQPAAAADEALQQLLQQHGGVAAFAHVMELDALFIARHSGELLLLHTASRELEEVGLVQGGVAVAAWSPDGELLAVLGFNQLLMLMTKEWDVLAEVPVPPPAHPQEQAQQAGQQPHAAAQLLAASLSWRGDSHYLASNTLWRCSSSSSSDSGSGSRGGSSRVLHIWDREGCQLHATGQAAPGLESAMAWQPNSRHLYAAAAVPPPSAAEASRLLKAAPHQRVVKTAATAAAGGQQPQSQQQQQTPDASWLQHVMLFERNGLQHGGFDVPAFNNDSGASGSGGGGSSAQPSLVIHSLHWSCDSKTLAVVLAPAAAGSGGQQQPESWVCPREWQLQLWQRSNWHWFLKHQQSFELPSASGALLAAWDDAAALRLHLLSGAGSYSCLDFGCGVCVSARGTAAVVDGHQLLLTPLRHGLVPPPMCAVRAMLPCPATALAWWDGDVAADLAPCQHAAQPDQLPPPGAEQAPLDGSKVLARGLCEVLAAVLADGQLLLLRAVESDLWEETLEDQAALGGPRDYLLPLGFVPAAAAAAAAAASALSEQQGPAAAAAAAAGPAAAKAAAAAAAAACDDADDYYGGLAMPTGPWNALGTSAPMPAAAGSTGGDAGGVQLRLQRLLPVRADAGAREPSIPLAEGRQVLGLVWLSGGRLLLLATPLDDASGLEDGRGTVLVEVEVQLPAQLYVAAAAQGAAAQQGVQAAALRTSYAGGHVLAAAPHPAGGALLQLADGELVHYHSSGPQQQQPLSPLPAGACFPKGCATMLALPHAADGAGVQGAAGAALQAAARAVAAAPAVGLSADGGLHWGARLLAGDVNSVALRGGGPGGPALLYTTRSGLLYTVMLSQLPRYTHALPDEALGQHTWKRSEFPGELRAAMSAAMRPSAAAAAARDPHMRAVEQGAVLLACPWGDVGAVLALPRGNLEGVSPRLLTLAAICDALEQQAYGRAWELAVKHRVDLNLLVDYAWPRFLAAAPAFVAAVPDASDLCDLLLALQPSSVLAEGGLYSLLAELLGWGSATQPARGEATAAAAAADGSGGGGGGGGGSKVARACAALRAAVLALPGRYDAGHLKTVAMSYARSDPPSLEAALAAIREVKEASVAGPAQQQPAAASAAAAPAAAAEPGAAACSSAAAAAAAAEVAPTRAEAAVPAALGAAADAALRHLLLYVDVDELYRNALGLYDLALAFMVVSFSQKDPGEYLDELSRLGAAASEPLRRHAIDMSLGRHAAALRQLVAAGPRHFPAALALARERGLLRQLLALTQAEAAASAGQQAPGGQAQAAAAAAADACEPGVGGKVLSAQQRLVAVLAAHGEALLAARKAEDAAVAFSAAGLLDQALAAYKTAGAWRMAMVLSARLGHTQQQQEELARELAEQLQACGAGADAAVLLVQYLSDVDGGVAALVAAKEWREAARVAYAAMRPDLADTLVVPAAAQAAAALLADASEAAERIAKYSARLAEVRARRVALASALAAAEAQAQAGWEAGGPDAEDVASEAPSLASGLSMYTEATATAAGGGGSSAASTSAAPSTLGGRKAQRRGGKKQKGSKAGKIRAGSPGEEAALVELLATLGPARHVLEEAAQLAELLVLLQHAGDAAKLQQCVGRWQAAAAAAAADAAGTGAKQQAPAASQPGGGAAGGSSQAPAGAAAGEVHWKWDVLREHK